MKLSVHAFVLACKHAGISNLLSPFVLIGQHRLLAARYWTSANRSPTSRRLYPNRPSAK